MDPTEGLVLHCVALTITAGEGAFFTGLLSPRWSSLTASPGPMHGWKNAFDAGEWGLGRMANSLVLGCDCLGEVTLSRRRRLHRKGQAFRLRRMRYASTRRTTGSSGSTSTCSRDGPRSGAPGASW